MRHATKVSLHCGKQGHTPRGGEGYNGEMRALVPDLVVEALERGATIVTANERAARGVRRAWDELQRSRGLSAWETARALSWRGWMGALWHSLQIAGASDLIVLSAAQEHRVWLGIVAPDGKALGARRLHALAATCAEAYGRLSDFGGGEQLQRMRGTLSGDRAAFAEWVRLFEQHCRRERLLPAHALAAAAAELIRPEVVGQTDREVVLLGFDELLPAQAAMVSAWRAQIGSVSLPEAPIPFTTVLVRAQDHRAELRGFARWAAARLEAEPEARIALVVENLAGERDEIESVLGEILAPELADIQRDAVTAPFEFSLGRSLASEPLVRGAIDMLEWLGGPLPLGRIERLLLGPAIAAHREERAARGRLTSLLRREIRLQPEATIEQTLRVLDQCLASELSGLRRALRGLARSTSIVNAQQQSFGSWANEIGGVLEEALWAQGLNSRSYQVVERWHGLMDTLASFDFAGGVAGWTEVLESIRYLVRETIFAPERREAPIQVLGSREAAGSRFDALWVLRSGEMQWPPEQSSHPLLPHTLERSLGIPGGDRDVTRRSGLLLTQRLAASAPEVLFSYAERTAEGSLERAAAEIFALQPVLKRLEEVAPAETVSAVVALERLADIGHIAPYPDRPLGGGVRVLELQAQCGFLAFSELRLEARELPSDSFGLSAGERGNAVHRALETLWNQLKSQQALLELSEAERWAVLETAITEGLQRSSRAAEGVWARSYLEVQRERLRRLLRAWLDQEMKRPPFIVSQQEEKTHALQVGPLRLSVRVDRIDLVDGSRVLLDYKTGFASTSQWKGERPDRPQVPLYAVLASTPSPAPTTTDEPNDLQVAPLGAVAFAKVVAGGEMGLQGFEREELSLLPHPGGRRMEQPSFDDQVQQWSAIVARLATEFADGDARVRPKQFPGSCVDCGHRILCRVDAADFDGTSAADFDGTSIEGGEERAELDE